MITFDSLKNAIDAIVIGTSAGGIEALSAILPALPVNLHASVFIVIHLPRDRPSLLVDIFSPKCVLPVQEAQDKEPVQSGTVYFAPPNYHLLLDKGPQLALSVDDPVNFSRPSIDVLFESAADIYGKRLLGVILTGGNEDGSKGLEAIGRAGGITVVQHPENAQVPFMPASALKRNSINFVLTLPHIAELFQTLNSGEKI